MSNTQTYHLKVAPSGHTLIGPSYATASLPDDDYFGYHWKCTCGAEAGPWIQNWPQSEEEAWEEWRLHFEELTGSVGEFPGARISGAHGLYARKMIDDS